MKYSHQVASASLIASFFACSAYGQVQPCEKQKLIASDAALLDLFGNSVSISGNNAIIGAWNADGPFAFAWGAAYIFELIDGQWIEQELLTPSDHNEQDRFGHVVAISGDIAVVGSPMNDDACEDSIFCDSGSAYVFRKVKGKWIEEQKLLAFDAEPTDQYGLTVAIDGDVIVIGSPWEDDACGGSPSCNAGAAYVYRFVVDQWVLDQKLTASDPDTIDTFAQAVSISGDNILVGARGDNDDGFNSGSAYIFNYNGKSWEETQKLTASDAEEGDEFGLGVSIRGDLLIVGALKDDTACPENILCNSGSAYVFRFNGKQWIQEQKLEAPDMAEGDQFGGSVSIYGDAAVVGSRWNDDLCPENPDCNSGAAYLFRFNPGVVVGWSLQQKLTQSDAAPVDLYGSAVAVNNHNVFIGSEGDDDDGTGSGSTYYYLLDGADSNGDGIADDCQTLGDLNDDGVVNTSDLLLLFASWGPCDHCKVPGDCAADFDGNCIVNTSDLLILLANWG
ncbi:MAG: hypothetical protein IH984_12435 [Planctomycetes bacterium]|nr:hypothetical protein [Planctomycetota bacterium]